jgi:hypothetical protein
MIAKKATEMKLAQVLDFLALGCAGFKDIDDSEIPENRGFALNFYTNGMIDQSLKIKNPIPPGSLMITLSTNPSLLK